MWEKHFNDDTMTELYLGTFTLFKIRKFKNFLISTSMFYMLPKKWRGGNSMIIHFFYVNLDKRLLRQIMLCAWVHENQHLNQPTPRTAKSELRSTKYDLPSLLSVSFQTPMAMEGDLGNLSR